MHYPHQVLLGFTCYKCTLILDDLCIGVYIYRPYPKDFSKLLSIVTTQSYFNFSLKPVQRRKTSSRFILNYRDRCAALPETQEILWVIFFSHFLISFWNDAPPLTRWKCFNYTLFKPTFRETLRVLYTRYPTILRIGHSKVTHGHYMSREQPPHMWRLEKTQ